MSMAGRMLREARQRAGLTQRQLSAKAGIPQETIARIEKGRVDPRVSTLDRLLEACEYGLESMPRLGIGIDRTQIRQRLSISMERRLEVAMADDAHYVEWRSRSGASPNERTGTIPAKVILRALIDHGVRFVLVGGLAAQAHGSPSLTGTSTSATPAMGQSRSGWPRPSRNSRQSGGVCPPMLRECLRSTRERSALAVCSP